MEKRTDDGNNHNSMTEMTDDWLLAFFENGEKGNKEQTPQQESDGDEPEEEAEITTQEQIYSYPDGTVYMGHMVVVFPKGGDAVCCDETAAVCTAAMSHRRHGSGTLRTPAFVYGVPLKSYTSDEAAENAHLAKWHEYIGTWKNDKLHGYGVHVQKSGNGGETLIFEGIWENGKPKKSIHSKDEDGDYDFDEAVFGW
jgi:hypothetical protein